VCVCAVCVIFTFRCVNNCKEQLKDNYTTFFVSSMVRSSGYVYV
jgi:hypothetical protein